MGPSRRVRTGATLLVLIGACFAVGASAQSYDETRQDLGLWPDPLARSPRLLAMGGLTYAVADEHRRIDLWEFGGNSAGLHDADSLSRLEIGPATGSRSGARDLAPGAIPRERQDFAMREVRLGYELWRYADRGGTTFGLIGDYGSLRTDRPSTPDLEVRRQFSVPNTMGVVSGHLPFLFPERLRYGFHVRHRYEASDDRYLTIVRNGAGEFIDKDGVTVAPPDFFTPDHRAVRSLGLGGALALHVAGQVLGAGFDYAANAIESRNDGDRYSTEIREDRPVTGLHVEWVSRDLVAGPLRLENGLRYENWSSSSNQRWVFSLSGGTGAVPITGRGGYGDREEEGAAVREWVRATVGALQIGGGVQWATREINFTPVPTADLKSFNYYRNFLYNKAGLDSLALPDSLVKSWWDSDHFDFGVGASYRLAFLNALVGAEFHSRSASYEQTISGPGPEGRATGFRGGFDARVTPVLRVQGGYGFESTDLDEDTEQNEYVAHTVSAGIGLAPAGATWQVDAGYSVTLQRADFDDLSGQRGYGQRGLLRIRWRI